MGSGLDILPQSEQIVKIARQVTLRSICARSTNDEMDAIGHRQLGDDLAQPLPLPFVWQWPTTGLDLVLFASIAVLAGLAELLVIKALEVAQAVVVAPLQYTLLIWGTMYGYLVFGQLPDGWTFAGALIIVATGLYTFYREWVVARERRAITGK